MKNTIPLSSQFNLMDIFPVYGLPQIQKIEL